MMDTTVNMAWQFLSQKFYVFSEFLFDEYIKSYLSAVRCSCCGVGVVTVPSQSQQGAVLCRTLCSKCESTKLCVRLVTTDTRTISRSSSRATCGSSA
jgi:hypothetical protein